MTSSELNIKLRSFPRPALHIYLADLDIASSDDTTLDLNVKLCFFPRSITSLPRRQLMNLHNNEAGRRVGLSFCNCDHQLVFIYVAVHIQVF